MSERQVDFIVGDIEKMSVDGCQVTLVELIIPEINDTVFTLFNYCKSEDPKRKDFFESIGIKDNGFENIKSKTGKCLLFTNNDGLRLVKCFLKAE